MENKEIKVLSNKQFVDDLTMEAFLLINTHIINYESDIKNQWLLRGRIINSLVAAHYGEMVIKNFMEGKEYLYVQEKK